jgi:hypothetical protein
MYIAREVENECTHNYGYKSPYERSLDAYEVRILFNDALSTTENIKPGRW